MRVRGIEQLLFETPQLRIDAEHVGFDLLYLLIEALHLRAVAIVGCARPTAEQAEGAEQYAPESLSHDSMSDEVAHVVAGFNARRKQLGSAHKGVHAMHELLARNACAKQKRWRVAVKGR